ncbi:hypothetical protein BARRETLEMON_48 [Arthrobacter phage BarretLemon]|uniref:Uncharacterized protein n=2 Tax=Marthavirus barretlemon TaxID=2560300 RepID=A0A386KNL2_9CAUD|nr:hypothetical protein BJD79_gp48 [Arthrobacter phage BarretLemon]AMM44510.1 hypothetical protein BARRETLEMON_48 [Arthrobacter phage BarretLemon]AYD86519.1 hypothetical protein SEA_LEEROYJ_48 [Arthrobacter phage LeeroyJ]
MTFASEKIVTARKQHKCGECFGIIQPGARYYRGAGSWEGDFWHMKWCVNCDSFRDLILYADSEFWEQCYGGISVWVSERMHVEMSTSFSWTFRLHMARLSSLFIRRWAGLGEELTHARAAMQAEKSRPNLRQPVVAG